MQLNKDFVQIVSLLFHLISLHYNNEHIEKDVMLTITESGLTGEKKLFTSCFLHETMVGLEDPS